MVGAGEGRAAQPLGSKWWASDSDTSDDDGDDGDTDAGDLDEVRDGGGEKVASAPHPNPLRERESERERVRELQTGVEAV